MKKTVLTWGHIDAAISALNLKNQKVYGVPKGGMIVAGLAKQKFPDIELIMDPWETKPDLILDDLIDSGATQIKYEDEFPDVEFMALFDKRKMDDNPWLVLPWETDHPAGEESVEQNIVRMLEYIGEDPNREGLLDTPKRVAKMYTEIFRGYSDPAPKLTCFSDEAPRGLIMDSGYFFSMCEHHMVPFFGFYYFGYIPDQSYIGASKIGRTVDHFAAKLQTAECLVREVLDHIENEIKPLGCILLMNGRHLCKEMRGLRKWNSPFEVIEARGILLANQNGCKDEFIARLASRI